MTVSTMTTSHSEDQAMTKPNGWTGGPDVVLVALDKHIKAERALGYEASAREGEEARAAVSDLYKTSKALRDDYNELLDIATKLVNWCDENTPAGDALYFVQLARNAVSRIKARAALSAAEGDV
jgi:dsDNA-binding SOS-regulon protein